jgi:stress-induced morphogen
MDPRHKLYKQLDSLDIDSEKTMSAKTDTEAESAAASSGVAPATIKRRLEEGLGATHVEIEDMSGRSGASEHVNVKQRALWHLEDIQTCKHGLITCVGGCGQMYEAIIVSPQFTKKTTLARHRLVNAVLKQEIAAIHAWTPKCHTPEEWEKKKLQV